MAGGPGSTQLVEGVTAGGGFALVPSGYLPADQFRARLEAVRDLGVGANLFVPSEDLGPSRALEEFREKLMPLAQKLGTEPGAPVWTDDDYREKLRMVAGLPWVSFTFGCPAAAEIRELHEHGTRVMVTVTSPGEAELARAAGADALCVQGREAGAHQGSFQDGEEPRPLLELLQEIEVGLPKIATGGLMTGMDIRRALDAGASAVQLGTAFLCCPEAGTNDTHRRALRDPRFTESRLTRAFTGRLARGLRNRFMDEYSAPRRYPEVHSITRPIRQAAAQRGDPQHLHLWAGEGWRSIRPLPAAELTKLLLSEAGC